MGRARAAEDVLATVAERTLTWLDERCRVKPLDAALSEAAAWIAYQLRPFVTGERAVANVARCVD
jgi:hypothetical protein